MMKKEKKRYAKPEIKKNKPMINITFATGTAIGATGGSPGAIVGG